MQPLPPEIYLPIAAALAAVITVLWREWAAERKHVRDLNRELVQDTTALRSIDLRLASLERAVKPQIVSPAQGMPQSTND